MVEHMLSKGSIPSTNTNTNNTEIIGYQYNVESHKY
jgi:hypothetical protein